MVSAFKSTVFIVFIFSFGLAQDISFTKYDGMINAFILTILAGLSTLIGGAIIFFIKKPKLSYLSLGMGFAAGVMIFISLTELLGESIENIGYNYAIISFFVGILIIYLIDILIPHSYEAENPPCKKKELERCGRLVAVGITIHNIPEGMIVLFSSIVDIRLGLIVAIAIAIHNIPEGIAIAMPIYYATGNKIKAFSYAAFSGIAEPIGAIIAYLFLMNFLNVFILNIILAAVAGIMVFISFDELLPNALKYEKHHITIAGVFIGMAVMAVSLAVI